MNRLPPVREAPTPVWMLRGPKSREWTPKCLETAKERRNAQRLARESERDRVLEAIKRLAGEGVGASSAEIAGLAGVEEHRCVEILRALARKHGGVRPRSVRRGYWSLSQNEQNKRES